MVQKNNRNIAIIYNKYKVSGKFLYLFFRQSYTALFTNSISLLASIIRIGQIHCPICA